MVPIGLDLSLTSTGWAVWGGDVGRIRTDLAAQRDLTDVEKRRYIGFVASGVVLNAGQPYGKSRDVLLVIESVPTRGARNIVTLGMLHGVFLDQLERAGLDPSIAYVDPDTLKRYLTGDKKAKKPQMVAAARSLGYTGAQHDEADAYALSMVGHHLLGGTTHLTPHRQSCLAAVEWLVPLPETAAV